MFHKYFLNNSGKRIHKWLHYFDIYERHLESFKDKSPTILEIGVFGGGSLEMWKYCFGKNTKVIGLDIKSGCKQHEQKDIEIFIGSQDDQNIINNIFTKYPSIDIVVDDGSHIMNHMIKSFNLIYPKINDNGVYIVEDTHTCYLKEYGGGLGNPGTFIEFAKKKIDEINAVHTKGKINLTNFTKSTDYISFYDSVVVFQKRKQGKRNNIITEAM